MSTPAGGATSTSTSAQGATDGRVRRGERTRTAIVDALLALLHQGVLTPTAAQIAEGAGVSVRSVFQHFEDLDALHLELAAEQARRVQPLLDPPDATGSLDERIADVAMVSYEHMPHNICDSVPDRCVEDALTFLRWRFGAP